MSQQPLYYNKYKLYFINLHYMYPKVLSNNFILKETDKPLLGYT